MFRNWTEMGSAHRIQDFAAVSAPLVLAFVLGPMLEQNLRRSLILSDGSFLVFVMRLISAVALGLALLLLVSSVVPYFDKRRQYEAFEE